LKIDKKTHPEAPKAAPTRTNPGPPPALPRAPKWDDAFSLGNGKRLRDEAPKLFAGALKGGEASSDLAHRQATAAATAGGLKAQQQGGAATLTPYGTRPDNWIRVGSVLTPASLTTNAYGVPQPSQSGFYLVTVPVDVTAGIYSHSSVGYYDAPSGQWTFSTAINGSSTPAPQADNATNPGVAFYPIKQGSGAGAVTPDQWTSMMFTDLQKLSRAYTGAVPFNGAAPWTSEFDGNCNVYTGYLLRSLGCTQGFLNAAGTMGGLAGLEMVQRNSAGMIVLANFTVGANQGGQAGATLPMYALN
jgi:hypothetical protein